MIFRHENEIERRIRNRRQGVPLYAGEVPKQSGELVIFGNRTERA